MFVESDAVVDTSYSDMVEVLACLVEIAQVLLAPNVADDVGLDIRGQVDEVVHCSRTRHASGNMVTKMKS